ncbi:MAG: zinc ribbon domain-containing protein [Clostridia bacterium]|nr:zinc ribbon domain-containing protein [Clostridia bacterium]MBQ7603546.1 zinc ribbon domain-containing protein [Clostridia bacterium]
MAFCQKCGAQIDDNAPFCPSCGAPTNAAAPVAAVNPGDHTAEYDPADISANKVKAMLCYLMGIVGVILAALTGTKSDYVDFHVREVLKITVLEILVGFISAVLVWTFIVPIAGFICLGILAVIQIIGFFWVCGGKAKELPIVKAFKFLK